MQLNHNVIKINFVIKTKLYYRKIEKMFNEKAKYVMISFQRINSLRYNSFFYFSIMCGCTSDKK